MPSRARREEEEDFASLSTDELIDKLAAWGQGVPRALVEAIVARGSEAVPRLAEIVSSRTWWAEQRHGYNAAVIHVMHLLGLIGDPAAADALLAPLRWDIDSDFLTESMPGILARLGPEALPVVRAFIDDPDQDIIYRSVAYTGLVGLALLRPELQPQVKLIGRQVALRSMATGKPFPAGLALNLISFQDPEDLRILDLVYHGDLWDDRLFANWSDVLDTYMKGLADYEVEHATRDPMDYFAPEEQARLKRVWAEWEADLQKARDREEKKRKQ